MGRQAAYQPRPVTVALMTFIPNFSGYYVERFEILKVCLASLFKHTPGEHDLMVLDNGSCPKVRAYLLELQERGLIRWLILGTENLGYLGGLNLLFQSAPGEFVAYSDDDVYFHPGWLEAAMAIHRTFPRLAYVTGCPARHNFGEYSTATLALPAKFPGIVSTVPGEWQGRWDEHYALSIGASSDYAIKHGGKQVPLFEAGGTRAWAVATHLQFVASRTALRAILPFPRTQNAMASSKTDPLANMPMAFDKRLDELGFARLTTEQPSTEHLGNTVTEHLRELVRRHGLEVAGIRQGGGTLPGGATTAPGLLGKGLLKVLNLPRMMDFIGWLQDRTFALAIWKQAQDRRKVSLRTAAHDLDKNQTD